MRTRRGQRGFRFEYNYKDKDGLRDRAEYWEPIGCNEAILKVVKQTILFSLCRHLKRKFFPHNQSSPKKSAFVNDSIKELLDTGRRKEVIEPPWVVNPLSVSSKGEKHRMIADLYGT